MEYEILRKDKYKIGLGIVASRDIVNNNMIHFIKGKTYVIVDIFDIPKFDKAYYVLSENNGKYPFHKDELEKYFMR